MEEPDLFGDVDWPPGVVFWRGLLNAEAQAAMAAEMEALCEAAGWIAPITPTGKPFSVEQMNCGPLGWVSDRRGYRYEPRHPGTAAPWPGIPQSVMDVWRACLPDAAEPECCLVNFYGPAARMGLHRDADEQALETPVLSISLGAPARFRLGNLEKRGATRSTILHSGDVMSFGGAARLRYHGVDRVLSADTSILSRPGRLNLTLRRVTPT